MIKLVVFDFDGVIADTIHLAVNTANRMLCEEGYAARITGEHIMEKGIKGVIKDLKIPTYKLLFHIKEGHRIVNCEIGSVKLFPGIKAAIKKMKRDYKLAMVTGNSKDNIRKVLSKNGMEGIFDFTIAGVSIFGKASKIKKAMKIAKVRNEEAVYIGDVVEDIDAARKAGIRVICVGWGFSSRKLLEGNEPDYMVESPDELPEMIKGI